MKFLKLKSKRAWLIGTCIVLVIALIFMQTNQENFANKKGKAKKSSSKHKNIKKNDENADTVVNIEVIKNDNSEPDSISGNTMSPQTPTIRSNIQTPTIRSNIQTPTIGSNIQTPTIRSNIQTPTIRSNIQTPTIGSNTQTPTIKAK